MYLRVAKPKHGQDARVEMINEVVFMICMNFSPIYSPLMTDKKIKY